MVQKTANEVMITRDDQSVKLKTDLKIVGVSVSEEHVAVWSGKTVAVYKLTDLTAFNVLGNAFRFLKFDSLQFQDRLKSHAYDFLLFARSIDVLERNDRPFSPPLILILNYAIEKSNVFFLQVLSIANANLC